MALPFSQAFCTPADLLQYGFELFELLRRRVLKYAFDQSGMPTKEGMEYPPPFFRQRNRPDPPIGAAFFAADQTFLIQAIHRHADRAGIEVHLWANSIYTQ